VQKYVQVGEKRKRGRPRKQHPPEEKPPLKHAKKSEIDRKKVVEVEKVKERVLSQILKQGKAKVKVKEREDEE
jgi:hypothetical protein